MALGAKWHTFFNEWTLNLWEEGWEKYYKDLKSLYFLIFLIKS